MGRIIKYHTTVERLPRWLQEMVDNKEARKAELLAMLDEWSESKTELRRNEIAQNGKKAQANEKAGKLKFSSSVADLM